MATIPDSRQAHSSFTVPDQPLPFAQESAGVLVRPGSGQQLYERGLVVG